jgi:hypothetical protein
MKIAFLSVFITFSQWSRYCVWEARLRMRRENVRDKKSPKSTTGFATSALARRYLNAWAAMLKALSAIQSASNSLGGATRCH